MELGEGINQLEAYFPDLIGPQAPENSLKQAVRGAVLIELETGNTKDIFSASVSTRTGDFPNIDLRLYDYRGIELPKDSSFTETDWTVTFMCGKGLYINYFGHEDQPAHNLFVNFVDTGSEMNLVPGQNWTCKQGRVPLYDIENTHGVLAFRYEGYPRGNNEERHLIIPERIKPFLGR